MLFLSKSSTLMLKTSYPDYFKLGHLFKITCAEKSAYWSLYTINNHLIKEIILNDHICFNISHIGKYAF